MLPCNALDGPDFTRHDKPMRRRCFIKIAAGTAFAASAGSTTLLAEKSVKPLRILILGGTGFTGPTKCVMR